VRKTKYQNWIRESDKGEDFCYCIWCDATFLRKNITGPKGHLQSESHKIEASKRGVGEITEPQKIIDTETITDTLDSDINKLELNLLEFIVKKNEPLARGEEFLDFLKENFPQNEIIQQATLSRRKATNTVLLTYKPLIVSCLTKIISRSPYSIILDTTTDKSKIKHFALQVQFWDSEEGVITRLHSVSDASSVSTAEQVLDHVCSLIFEDERIENNLIGVVGDGGSEIVKFIKLLKEKEKLKNIWSLHDLAHCCNLVASYAGSSIPNEIEMLVRNVFNHFSVSAMRTNTLLDLQEELGMKPLRMIRHADTRWLTLEHCLDRLISRWSELKLYFNDHAMSFEDSIKKTLTKQETLVYLKFIRVFVKKVNALNLIMQKDTAQITVIYKRIREIFNNLINHVLNEEYRARDVNDKLKLVKRNDELDLIFIDETCLKSDIEFDAYIEFLYKSEFNLDDIGDQNPTSNKRAAILKKMRIFIMRLCWKMVDVFPYDNALLEDISCIFPTTFSDSKWMNIAKRFETVLINKLYTLQEELERYKDNLPQLIEKYQALEKKSSLDAVVHFYLDAGNKTEYPTLSHLAGTIIALPHSSVNIERLFSQVKLVKNEKRSTLSESTLEALLLMKDTDQKWTVGDKYLSLLKQQDEMRTELNEVKKDCLKRKIDKIEDINNFIKETKEREDSDVDDETYDLILARRLKKVRLSNENSKRSLRRVKID